MVGERDLKSLGYFLLFMFLQEECEILLEKLKALLRGEIQSWNYIGENIQKIGKQNHSNTLGWWEK